VLLPGTASALMTTGDGGWSWQTPLPQGDALEAVVTTDTQHAVAVGDWGAIITTADGGVTWTSHDSGLSGAHVNDVSFSDQNDGWAVVWTQTPNSAGYGPFVIHSADGGATWTVQASLPYARAVTFIDAHHGWVCGNNAVWSTSDGGLTWKAHDVPSNWYLSDVVFTDANHGWVVGHRENIMGQYYYPIILATTDGGVTWKKQYFPGGRTVSLVLASVAFPDARHGWAIANSGNILATSDGGAHWKAQRSGTTDALQSVTFADASHGWIVAVAYEPKTEQSTSGLLATTDAGASWTRQAVGIPVKSVEFADSMHGYAVGADGSIAATIDGGTSWQVRSLASPASGIPALWDIAFADAAHGWAVGGGMDTGTGVILATADGGATWSAQPTGSGLLGVSFPDAVHGWAVGGGSHYGGSGPVVGSPAVILHTADGGLTWQSQPAGTSFGSLNGVDFVDADHGCIAGSSGAFPAGHPVLAATSDGGVTWNSVTLPQASGSAWAVSFVNAQHGWAVTSLTSAYPSAIYVTSDGGLTWTSQYVVSGVVLRDVTFTDANHGWAVGLCDDPNGSCAILSTTDGGVTWTRQDLPSEYGDAGLHVTFIDGGHGWVACGPTVLATVDGGLHWWTERTGAEVRALAFVDQSHGWAAAQTADWVHGDGGILSTTTGGFAAGPVTSVSGADDNWHKRAVHLTFSATDVPGGPGMAGGQAKTQFRLDDGPWITGTALTIPAPTNHSNDGIHRIGYFSTDVTGTTEVAKSLTVQIDTTGPTTAARNLSGHKRTMLQLSCRVSDKLSYMTGSRRVVLRTAAGRTVHVFKTPDIVPTGIWISLNWAPRATGVYRYYVYATDMAGNRQRNVASGTVVVR
jgi:photosystem II stability/assembly factor-like uncharacterized protein